MSAILHSPLPFPERILLYGDGGSGKTDVCINIASHVEGRFRVIESDMSAAWVRGMALRYPGVEDRVSVTAVDDWEGFMTEVDDAVDSGDPDSDWIVIDSASPASYQWVQEWVLEYVYGEDLPAMMLQLRRQIRDDKEFKAARLELMNWDLVKKEYRKFWRAVQRWKGHMILTAEAKRVGYWEERSDPEAKLIYGTLGFYPEGQNKIRHAMSTTLYLDHPRSNRWRMTTIKDRGREELDKEQVDDFGLDYLVGVAGWKPKKTAGDAGRKKSKAEMLAELED